MNRGILRQYALVSATALALLLPAAPAAAQTELRVLLIGNSLMRGVKRPLVAMFQAIGVDVQIKTALPGTWTLEDHASSSVTASRISARPWDVVMIHGRASGITDTNYPAIRTLNDEILAAAASFGVDTQVVLAMTWRDRGVGSALYNSLHGDPGGTYGYIPIAFELDVPVAPIGWAVRDTLDDALTFDMWKGHKGRHLSKYGHYLAASVLYAVIQKETPIGAFFKPRFDPAIILYLQTLADSTVFGNPAEWNLIVP